MPPVEGRGREDLPHRVHRARVAVEVAHRHPDSTVSLADRRRLAESFPFGVCSCDADHAGRSCRGGPLAANRLPLLRQTVLGGTAALAAQHGRTYPLVRYLSRLRCGKCGAPPDVALIWQDNGAAARGPGPMNVRWELVRGDGGPLVQGKISAGE